MIFALLLLPFCSGAAPGSPGLISPASNSVNMSTSVVLNVSVSDPNSSALTVKFFGRIAPPGPDFTVAALPDTQYYTAQSRGAVIGMFTAQTDWLVNNRVSRNVAYVAGLGDIVDHGDTNAGPSNLAEWLNATNALYRLENPVTTGLPQGIPYGNAVGNHDQSPNGDPNGTSAFYNQFFGVSHFAGRSYYGGNYGTNNDNHFDLFSAGGLDFVVVFFEYDVSAASAILDWANNVLQTNLNRRAIVVSHYIGSPTTPSSFGSQGTLVYNALKGNPNLFLMLSGHVNGEGSRQDVFNGRTITTLVSDYQFRANGGNGYMRLMEFSPSNSVIRVKSYSPWLNQYETDADSEFTVPYAMQPASGNFLPLGTNSNVPSGSNSAFTWPNLAAGVVYEWYATVSDGAQTTTGPTWKFTTSLSTSNAIPTITSFSHQTIQANTSTTNLSFTVSDAEMNPANLLVNVFSSNETLLAPGGIALTGVGANRTLRLTPATNEAGATWVTVTVSDGSAATSRSFMLKVMRSKTIALWDFNSNPPDNNTSTGTLVPAVGSGTVSSVGTATNSLNSNVSPVSFDSAASDNSKWRLGSFPAQGTGNKSSGAEFRVSTAGYRNIALSWDHYNSASGSRFWRVQYTLDGTNFIDHRVYTNPTEVTWFPTGVSFSAIPGANNNPSFGIRFVSEWESTATGDGLDQFIGTQGTGAYTTAGTLWLDMVTFSGDVIEPTLAVQRTNQLVKISWPAAGPIFSLQSRTNLGSGTWTSVAQPPVSVGGQNVVTLTNSNGNQVFRLFQ